MRFELTPGVKVILIINLLIFVLENVTHGAINNFLALSYIGSAHFFPTQLVTYMFAHADFGHILGNMFTLVIFGPLLERFLGSNKFLVLYFFTGIGAALLHAGINYWEVNDVRTAIQKYLASPNGDDFYSLLMDKMPSYYQYEWSNFAEAFTRNPNNPDFILKSKKELMSFLNDFIHQSRMLGASGAVSGVVIACALLFPNTELFLLFIPFPIKVKYIALIYAVGDIYSIVQNSREDHVAHFAHLGGMIFAFFLVEYWKRRRDTFY